MTGNTMSRVFYPRAFVYLICLGSGSVAWADVQDEILQVVKEYDRALLERDKEFLENLYEDEGQFILIDGRHVEKQAYIAEHLRRILTESKSSKQVIRSIGDGVAVETGTFLAIGTLDGEPIKEHLSYTTVWVKRDGKWRVAAEQVTPITEASVTAQTAAPSQPGPEHQVLEGWAGEWTFEGVSESTPFNPMESADRFAGKLTSRMVMSGLFLESRWADKRETGYVEDGIGFTSYDPATKSYVTHDLEANGSVSRHSPIVTSDTWSGSSTLNDSKGTVYNLRYRATLSEDRTTMKAMQEYSSDGGKTWTPFVELTMHKVK
jgi:uncharacterized protein (TIGR02246 family)